MSLFAGPGILISLPGRETWAVPWRASLVEVDEVLSVLASRDLRVAIHLLREAASRQGVAVRCVARPEVFDNRTARYSIAERARGFGRHVCLSDGETFKPIAGLENVIFLYKPAFTQGARALARLNRRAPEMMASLHGQINSRQVFGAGDVQAMPPQIVLTSDYLPLRPRSTPRRLVFSHFSVEDTVNRMRDQEPAPLQATPRHLRAAYVPLTERALDDVAFARVVADLILEACFDPTLLLILRAPFDADGDGDLARRMGCVHRALLGAGVIIPRSRLGNIFVLDDDISEDDPIPRRLPMTIHVHETFDFWRHTPRFYAAADRVVAYASSAEDEAVSRDLTPIYGSRAERRRIGGGEDPGGVAA